MSVYTVQTYKHGELIDTFENLTFAEAKAKYNQHYPFTEMGVDVYEDGVRWTFGHAMDVFVGRIAPIILPSFSKRP